MALVLVGFAFIVGVGLVLGLVHLAMRVPEAMTRRRVDSRLDDIARGQDRADGGEKGFASLLKAQKVGPLPGIDAALSKNARGASLGAWIEQSGTKATLSSVLVISVVLGAAGAVGLLMLTRVLWSMPFGFGVGAALPFVVLRWKRVSRLHRFEEQFPEALDLIARALKAGHAFATGMKMAADEMPEPVGPEFRKTFDEQNFGLPMKDALDNLTVRIPILDVRFFATAVLIQRETGGNLSEILENLAHVVRERFKILRQVRVYTAHGRMTGYVLLALPAALGIALMFINPDHMNMLFRERIGQMLLMGALVMQTVGFLWIRQIVKIEV